MDDSAYLSFLRLVEGTSTLNPADEALVRQSFESVTVKKGDMLVVAGQKAQYMYFIQSGYVRMFHWEDGEEITNHLGGPGGFITAYSSFVTQMPSDETAVTLTPCHLLRITKQALDRLYQNSHAMALFGLKMADQYLVFNNQRGRDLITLSAQERYEKLLKSKPDLIQHVPLQYIASYIGVKPESLSRIRRNRTSKSVFS